MRWSVAPGTIALAAVAMVIAGPAMADNDHVQSRRIYPRNAITCLAGCGGGHAPRTVGLAPNIATHPAFNRSAYDAHFVLRDVWCGDRGGCVASNHIAPPRLRDHDETHYISVFYWR